MVEWKFDVKYWVRENYWAMADLLGPRYMDFRIVREGMVWGEKQSAGAEKVLSHFQEAGVRSILDVGCGYGRDALYFAKNGFDVTGIEYSNLACNSARQLCSQYLSGQVNTGVTVSDIGVDNQDDSKAERTQGKVDIIHADIRTWMPKEPTRFDAAFFFKTFHQFRHETVAGPKHPMSAHRILNRIIQFVRPGGLIAISTFSTSDHNYPSLDNSNYKGNLIEEDTYDVRGHRPVAFYTEDRIRHLMDGLELVHLDHLVIEEDHDPDGKHKHGMWIAMARVPAVPSPN